MPPLRPASVSSHIGGPRPRSLSANAIIELPLGGLCILVKHLKLGVLMRCVGGRDQQIFLEFSNFLLCSEKTVQGICYLIRCIIRSVYFSKFIFPLHWCLV